MGTSIANLRILCLAAFVLAAMFLANTSSAWAQPGQTHPAPPPQSATPVHPDYAPQPPNLHLLTWEERRLLARGEISPEATFSGGMLGTFLGFGLGHAAQGRYGELGWIFTAGEIASMTAMFTGLVRCLNGEYESNDDVVIRNNGCQGNEATLLIGGAIGFMVFRTWEMIDSWVGPTRHNARVRAARAKAHGYVPQRGYSLYLVPSSKGSGAVGGLTIRF